MLVREILQSMKNLAWLVLFLAVIWVAWLAWILLSYQTPTEEVYPVGDKPTETTTSPEVVPCAPDRDCKG